jgi:hypothetical protein
MKTLSRWLLPISCALLLAIFFSPSAWAMDCSQCTPYSSCGQFCTYCITFSQDGCLEEAESSCGSPCMQCTPNFVEVSRELRGTYGNGSMFSCSHHKVEWVTREDTNHCNTDSAYWTASTCEDTIDGGKSGGWFPDCCNGYPSDLFTCNHYHNC